ncbi:glycoside hydrolase family 2 protein [Brachybacterium sp. DNPG3]
MTAPTAQTVPSTPTTPTRADAVELRTGWTLSPTGPGAERLPASVPAEVPGTSHTALLAAGAIEHPYRDDVSREQEWMFDLGWTYRLELDPEQLDLASPRADERVELALDGVDTFAEVSLAGERLGATTNMHRSWRYDVGALLDGTAKELRVDIAGATAIAEAEHDRQHRRPSAYPTPYNATRKMAASFGWDWGPDLRTAGLWKPVRLERWSVARLAEVRPVIRLEGTTGVAELHVRLDRTRPGDVVLALSALGRTVEVLVPGDQRSAVITLELPEVPVWWPVGYGDQPLVDLRLEAREGEALLDDWSRRVGFRTVAVDTEPDEHGTPFTFVVNGRRIFAKGVNWIPDDHLLTTIDRDRLARRIDQALDAHCNMVRVWGGGIHESDDFYELCDESGLMVWQDFLLACAAYSEEQPLRAEIEAEARENVVRLMSHPSLVLYNGGNENVWGYEDWDWKKDLEGRSWGAHYAAELFPRIVAELDPTRPYSANSPYSPGTAPTGVHPNDPDHGTHHEWEVWNRRDYVHYRDAIPRFCSEFGFQGPPAWSTLQEWLAVDGTPITEIADPKEHPVFLAHQKAEDGNAKLDTGLAAHLGVPESFSDWHWATQLNQARAVGYALDHYRRHWPRTAGALVWQLNDCWPVTSWAAVDWAERPKPLWYALRESFAPRRLVVAAPTGASTSSGAPSDGSASAAGLELSLINDTDERIVGELALRRIAFDGTELAVLRIPISADERAVTTIAVPASAATAEDPTREALVAEFGDLRTVHLFTEVKDARLEDRPFDAVARPVEGGYAIEVTARSLVVQLTPLVDRAAPDAEALDALVTIPAGETATVLVSTTATDLEQALVAPEVLRSANDLAVLARAADQVAV